MDRKEIKKAVLQAISTKYGDNRVNENERTEHGNNIAGEIGGDAYGYSGYLTIADVYAILDAIHTNFMDAEKDNKFLSIWMNELLEKYPDLDIY